MLFLAQTLPETLRMMLGSAGHRLDWVAIAGLLAEHQNLLDWRSEGRELVKLQAGFQWGRVKLLFCLGVLSSDWMSGQEELYSDWLMEETLLCFDWLLAIVVVAKKIQVDLSP